MNFRRIGCAVLIICLAWAPMAFGKSGEERFTYEDVHRVMEQLFVFHVDKKEMSVELLRRSYEAYIDQFDTQKLYLLRGEIDRWTNRPTAQLTKALSRYESGDYSDYVALNGMIKSSIVRSRQMRVELRTQIVKWINEGRKADLSFLESKLEYCKTLEELRERTGLLMFAFAEHQMERFPGLTTDQLDRVWVLFEKRLRSDENLYLLDDPSGRPLVSNEAENFLTLRVLKAMARSLDSHTDVYSPEEAQTLRLQLMKGFTGVGIVLEEQLEGVVITRLVKGGPADRSGKIMEEDRLVEVDGHQVAQYPFARILDFLRGERGSTVMLGVSRPTELGGREIIQVALKREPVVLAESRVEIAYEQFQGGIIGLVALDSFYESDSGITSAKDVKQAITELEKVGTLKGLVLDLRQNLGGFLSQAIQVAGLFITNGVVAISRYSDGSEVYFRDLDGSTYYDGPLVILTSRASASAAEIVAQALQDYGRAVVVGDERTYGKGSIQHQTITDEEAETHFKVTVGRYYTVSGKSTQLDGVRADIVVPSALCEQEIGEIYVKHPLTRDRVTAAYHDNLNDLDPAIQRYFVKYYMPTIQQKSDFWERHMALLKQNSNGRLETSKAYADFLKESGSIGVTGFHSWIERKDNYQAIEAMNVLKDMILIQEQADAKETIAR
jgi:carboxyl-terminal processing protease